MTLNLDDKLPVALQSFRSEFESTLKEFVKIELLEDAPEAIWSSKVGGFPYLLADGDYPVDEQNRPLNFVAQIDFSTIPSLAGFPTSGLIQFFVGVDDMYGLDFDAPSTPTNFRVVYHPTIIKEEASLTTDFSSLDAPECSPFNSPKSYALAFSTAQELINFKDYRFDTLIGDKVINQFPADKKWDIIEEYVEKNTGAGHKMGGYPHFTQEDARDSFYDVLLFQLDSDKNKGIMWGDMGVANFFIDTEDLAALDFSDVLYNWDCY